MSLQPLRKLGDGSVKSEREKVGGVESAFSHTGGDGSIREDVVEATPAGEREVEEETGRATS